MYSKVIYVENFFDRWKLLIYDRKMKSPLKNPTRKCNESL